MAIKWTPWFNVPTKKRLELLSIGFFIFCFLPIGLLSFSILIMLYIMVTKLIANGAYLSLYLHALMYFICILLIVCWKYFCASNLCTVFCILVLWLEDGHPTVEDEALGKYLSSNKFSGCLLSDTFMV